MYPIILTSPLRLAGSADETDGSQLSGSGKARHIRFCSCWKISC